MYKTLIKKRVSTFFYFLVFTGKQIRFQKGQTHQSDVDHPQRSRYGPSLGPEAPSSRGSMCSKTDPVSLEPRFVGSPSLRGTDCFSRLAPLRPHFLPLSAPQNIRKITQYKCTRISIIYWKMRNVGCVEWNKATHTWQANRRNKLHVPLEHSQHQKHIISGIDSDRRLGVTPCDYSIAIH